jgi:tRNA modification GTPase
LGPVPCDVYLWPTHRSYTRQPVAEIHLPGSPPLVDAALQVVCRAGARLAQAGEFTLRAFLAGRLDLPQAEAVLGVIDAVSQRELQVALSQLAGGLSGPLNRLRDELVDLCADLEAGLDFAEEDLEFISRQQLDQRLYAAADQLGQLSDRMGARSVSDHQPRVVLRGWPNVGKSSLLNALAGAAAALVSEASGTTRDYLTRSIELAGNTCLLIDTAGVAPQHCSGTVDGRAQEMTEQQQRHAHLQLFCLDATRPLCDGERRELSQPSGGDRLLVLTKIDQPRRINLDAPALETSSKTGQGLDELRAEIRGRLAAGAGQESNVVAGTATRCRESLRGATECLERGRALIDCRGGDELVAAEVRLALDELGKVVGAVSTDDVLDRIFSRFCLGK